MNGGGGGGGAPEPPSCKSVYIHKQSHLGFENLSGMGRGGFYLPPPPSYFQMPESQLEQDLSPKL